MKRRTAREYALQALFQMELADTEAREAIDNVLAEKNEESDAFLEELVFGYDNNKEQIDSIIRQNLENWTLERMGNVDRAILRVAVCEMTQMEDIPVNVTMNEAIEIAKIYGDDESKGFINAVLSKIKGSL